MLSDDGGITLRQLLDEAICPRQLGCFSKLFIRRLGICQAQVGRDGVIEQVRRLRRPAQRGAPRLQWNAAQVNPVHADVPGARFQEAQQQAGGGALARAGRPVERSYLARFQGEGCAAQGMPLAAIGVAYIFEGDPAVGLYWQDKLALTVGAAGRGSSKISKMRLPASIPDIPAWKRSPSRRMGR